MPEIMSDFTPALLRRLSLAAPLTAALLLGACSGLDPELRAGEWHPSHVNEVNLAAMVQNPSDLARGRGVAGADGAEAVAAVARLRSNTVKALPDSGLAEVRLQSNGGGGSAGSGGSAVGGGS